MEYVELFRALVSTAEGLGNLFNPEGNFQIYGRNVHWKQVLKPQLFGMPEYFYRLTDQDGWNVEGNRSTSIKTARDFGLSAYAYECIKRGVFSAMSFDFQNKWRWCSACQIMHYSGGLGVCPANNGGDHKHDSNYYLLNMSKNAPGQEGWKWCSRCMGLAFSARIGVCPKGGPHDHSTSGNYTLEFNHNGHSDKEQPEWRWCHKCEGLYYGNNASKNGVCPASGQHENVNSGDYLIKFE